MSKTMIEVRSDDVKKAMIAARVDAVDKDRCTRCGEYSTWVRPPLLVDSLQIKLRMCGCDGGIRLRNVSWYDVAYWLNGLKGKYRIEKCKEFGLDLDPHQYEEETANQNVLVDTSKVPGNCQAKMRMEGGAYPRTCPICKLGPCPYKKELPEARLSRPLPANGVADCPLCKSTDSVSRHNSSWSCQCGFSEIVDEDREAEAGVNRCLTIVNQLIEYRSHRLSCGTHKEGLCDCGMVKVTAEARKLVEEAKK